MQALKPSLIFTKPLLFCFACIIISNISIAQRVIEARLTTKKIVIDGIISEDAWQEAAVIDSFIEFRPVLNDKEHFDSRTICYLMYNDEGIYFGGHCYEKSKDSIISELVGRDGFGANDFIAVIFDTYYDKLNAFEYFVTPLNEQWDAKFSPPAPNSDEEDFSWNAVWQSATKINDTGWDFEMFIPFAAIRFGKTNIQDWGLNIVRLRKKTSEQFAWNPVSPSINGFLTQAGVWKNIKNIKPPIRLQLSPYISTYANHYPAGPGQKSWTSSFNAGMDIKYGINQAFTLDLTLIPDFGQVQSDSRVLNLTPFEVQFAEYRNFFTEGTDLFSKGSLFYSRRVGGQPLHYSQVNNWLSPGEKLLKNPGETRLINGAKISGRSKGGLGIGFFNAITAPQHATIEKNDKSTRKIQTSPLTNYNIVVLNQSLKNNSSISFVNTNVLRNGADYDANVMMGLFEISNKKNTWNVGGNIANSQRMNTALGAKSLSGFRHVLYFGKTSGNFTFNFLHKRSDTKYNSNDLGYFTNNNELNHSLELTYRWLKSTAWYNNFKLQLELEHQRQLVPAAHRASRSEIVAFAQLKNLWGVGLFGGYEPKGNNFFEPRTPGWFFRSWSNYYMGGSIETNYARRYAVNLFFLYVDRSLFSSTRKKLEVSQKYRVNNKLSLRHEIAFEPQKNNAGYADKNTATNEIIFGRRGVYTVENGFTIKYNFSRLMGINTVIRHYWSKVEYKEYFTLLKNGGLKPNSSYTGNSNKNQNFFNIDMVFTWQIAPGSFLNIVWKKAAENFSRAIENNYFKNFDRTLSADQNNNLSLRLIYFIDYNTLRKKHTR